jgi:hypothetical protein
MYRCLLRRSLVLATLGRSRRDTVRIEPSIPVATYSIVARDPATGDGWGVAVQSHLVLTSARSWPWAESGVGAVATQSFVEPA